MKLIIILGLIVELAWVSGDCKVGKTVEDFDIDKVSSDMLKCFLYQAVTATTHCYYVHFVVCSKTLSVYRAIYRTLI